MHIGKWTMAMRLQQQQHAWCQARYLPLMYPVSLIFNIIVSDSNSKYKRIKDKDRKTTVI